jgi:hypothetical protein
MFLVCVSYPIVEFTEGRERRLTKAAGRRSDRSGSSPATRSLEWLTEDFQAAVELRRRLADVPGVTALLREE